MQYPLLIIIWCMMVVVQPFCQHQIIRHSRHNLYGYNNDDNNIIKYGIGGENLSQRWIELVREGHVTATTVLTHEESDDDESVRVRYGVRLEEEKKHLFEFAEILPNGSLGSSTSNLRERVLAINETLTELQSNTHNQDGLAIQCIYEAPYVAQLQLVRTLRPPRSKDMGSNHGNEKVSCQPPPYDASKDSFLVGSLRLCGHGEFHGEGSPRERAARVLIPKDCRNDETCAYWDIYHNISPVGMCSFCSLNTY